MAGHSWLYTAPPPHSVTVADDTVQSTITAMILGKMAAFVISSAAVEKKNSSICLEWSLLVVVIYEIA